MRKDFRKLWRKYAKTQIFLILSVMIRDGDVKTSTNPTSEVSNMFQEKQYPAIRKFV